MLDLTPKGEPIVLDNKEDVQVSLTPPVIEGSNVDEVSDESGLELTKDIAITILNKVAAMLENKDLTIADMKDLTSMHKSVGDYYNKLGSGNAGSRAGLARFIARMKA